MELPGIRTSDSFKLPQNRPTISLQNQCSMTSNTEWISPQLLHLDLLHNQWPTFQCLPFTGRVGNCEDDSLSKKNEIKQWEVIWHLPTIQFPKMIIVHWTTLPRVQSTIPLFGKRKYTTLFLSIFLKCWWCTNYKTHTFIFCSNSWNCKYNYWTYTLCHILWAV